MESFVLGFFGATVAVAFIMTAYEIYDWISKSLCAIEELWNCKENEKVFFDYCGNAYSLKRIIDLKLVYDDGVPLVVLELSNGAKIVKTKASVIDLI